MNVYEFETEMLLGVGDFSKYREDEPLCGLNWDSYCNVTQTPYNEQSLLKVNIPMEYLFAVNVEIVGSVDDDFAIVHDVIVY